MNPVRLDEGDVDAAIAVLTEAFDGYPVVRFVLGEDDGPERLSALVHLFVRSRFLRGEAVFGVRDPGAGLVAVATTTRPEAPPPPPAFAVLRAATWRTLGADALARYEAYVAASDLHPVAAPHFHLNMLGVRRAFAGRGIGRALLGAVQGLSAEHATSTGVSLDTEEPANVAFYERAGYRVLGKAPVGPGIDTWALWRPDVPQSE